MSVMALRRRKDIGAQICVNAAMNDMQAGEHAGPYQDMYKCYLQEAFAYPLFAVLHACPCMHLLLLYGRTCSEILSTICEGVEGCKPVGRSEVACKHMHAFYTCDAGAHLHASEGLVCLAVLQQSSKALKRLVIRDLSHQPHTSLVSDNSSGRRRSCAGGSGSSRAGASCTLGTCLCRRSGRHTLLGAAAVDAAAHSYCCMQSAVVPAILRPPCCRSKPALHEPSRFLNKHDS